MASESDLAVLQPQLEPRLKSLLALLAYTLENDFLPVLYERGQEAEGMRVIQQGRFEMFVQCAEKKCTAFEELCQMILDSRHPDLHTSFFSIETMRAGIVDYAKATAALDKRVGPEVEFGPFSFIISDGSVPEQLPHVDVLYPSFQFGMIVSENAPGTRVYRAKTCVSTPGGLMEFLDVSSASSKIGAALEKFPDAVKLLKDYGICLSTVDQNGYWISSQLEGLKPGTVLSLPGSVLHAGPETSGFRMVLFYSAYQNGSDVYDPDIQYFDGLLLGEILLKIWPHITDSDRWTFLRTLYLVAKRYPALHKHFVTDSFNKLLKQLASTDTPDSCIKTFVESASPFDTTTQSDENPIPLEQVSVDGLMTVYNGEREPLAVYRLSKASVCIQFLRTSQWHGKEPSEPPFVLTLRKGHTIFDGTNGSLINDQGDKIICYVPCRTKQVQSNEVFPIINSDDNPPDWIRGIKRRKTDEDEDYVPE